MFEALDNFRDFGGYPTADGRRVRTGRLFRSAHPADATDEDLARLAGLNLDLIVDLRRQEERERQPGRRPPGFAGMVIENDIGRLEDDWLTFVRNAPELTPQAFEGYMVAFYRGAPHDPRHIDLFSRFFQVLAETDGAVLVHCAAGKDRTGLLAALTLHLAGVPDDHILHDYMLTNDSEALRRRVPQITRYLIRETGRDVDEAAVAAGVGVELHFLETAFTAIRERDGSLDAYIRNVLGVDEARRAAILDRLLE